MFGYKTKILKKVKILCYEVREKIVKIIILLESMSPKKKRKIMKRI
jgi:hypothetical protein